MKIAKIAIRSNTGIRVRHRMLHSVIVLGPKRLIYATRALNSHLTICGVQALDLEMAISRYINLSGSSTALAYSHD